MALKGLKGFRYAKLTEDTEESIKYEDFKKVPGARDVKITPKVDSAELYGDDQLMEVASGISAINVEIDVTDLPLDVRADLTSQKFENGILIEDKNFNPSNIAFGFMAPKSTGGNRLVLLTKGQMEPLAEEAKTKQDKISFQTQKVKFKFMPRVHDGVSKLTADDDIKGAPTESEFFTVDTLINCKAGSKTIHVDSFKEKSEV